jgi:hypothetical protein
LFDIEILRVGVMWIVMGMSITLKLKKEGKYV